MSASVPHAGVDSIVVMRRCVVTIAIALLMPAAANADDAKRAYQRGAELYAAGEFEKAAAEFAKAYESDNSPQVTFAYAQAARRAGDCETALPLYEKLLQSMDSDSQRAGIQRVMQECKPPDKPVEETADAGDEPDANPPPKSEKPTAGDTRSPQVNESLDIVTPPRPAAPPRDRTTRQSRVLPLMTIGLGVAGLGVGTTYYLLARSDIDDANNAGSLPSHKRLEDRADSRQTYATIGFIAGGAVVALGTVWLLAGGNSSSDDGPIAAPWFGSDATGVAISGSF